MRTILHILELVALYILWGNISTKLWFGLFAFLIFLYFAGKTHVNARGSEPHVERFWYIIAGLVFFIDIISIIVLYSYIFFK